MCEVIPQTVHGPLFIGIAQVGYQRHCINIPFLVNVYKIFHSNHGKRAGKGKVEITQNIQADIPIITIQCSSISVWNFPSTMRHIRFDVKFSILSQQVCYATLFTCIGRLMKTESLVDGWNYPSSSLINIMHKTEISVRDKEMMDRITRHQTYSILNAQRKFPSKTRVDGWNYPPSNPSKNNINIIMHNGNFHQPDFGGVSVT